ncbi:short-chain dehydrogenase [Xylariomycetidae sp. FL2044]|nr:short-chain dehydrogenase [Xylariomycetidae sp. FL2044]
MSRPLEGKLAIVNGASRGIGASISRKLASYGCALILTYTSPSSPARIHALQSSLSAEHQTRSPPFQIDILINNAGIAKNGPPSPPSRRRGTSTPSTAVNVLGPPCCWSRQAAAPYLPRDRSGPRRQRELGVRRPAGFVEHTVNAVNPGPVLTDMWEDGNSEAFARDVRAWAMHAPLMRARDVGVEGVGDDAETIERARREGGRPAWPAWPEEVAGVVAMLCGRDAAWCTGQVVCANGGMVVCANGGMVV